MRKTIAGLAMLSAFALGRTFDFASAARGGEMTVRLSMKATGANWAKTGAEAAVADVRVDGGPAFQVMLFAGEAAHEYPLFLGPLTAGAHWLSVERNAAWSAAGAGLEVLDARFESSMEPAVLRAPVLYARANTVGKFTDVPLLVYAEQLRENGDDVLEYSVIFTNEDGGTSTRALMARWGRTTDIEYVYRLNLRTGAAIIQSKDHKDVEYRGRMEGLHPVLMPITNNNMVGGLAEGETPAVRYQIAPLKANLSSSTREQVMNDNPFTWRIMSEELKREGKLRPFGTVDGENISDPRNYLYVAMKVESRNAGVGVAVRLTNDSLWRSGDLGRADYAISRAGWVQTTVELPPGTPATRIAEIGLQCVVAPAQDRRMPLSGECHVERVSSVYMLGADYRPGRSVWALKEKVDIPTGEMRTFALKR